MDYDTDDVSVRERHAASVTIQLLARDTGEDDIVAQEPPHRVNRGADFTWRPDRLDLGWDWDIEAGEWVCDSALLTGSRLRQDGSVGKRREEMYLIPRWSRDNAWTVKAPAYTRELEERFRPTSYVGAE